MTRTQVQLTQSQVRALRRASAASGKSVAELIRKGVDQFLRCQSEVTPEERIARAIRAAGKFSSGARDVSIRHDKHLADAFGR